MKSALDTGLKAANAPIEWATIADGIVYTAQIPMKADGSIETGDIATQTELTLGNLRQTVEAAGGSMADVTQVLVYLPDPADFPGMNEVYRRHFPQPYPNRATVIAQLMVAGARIEIVAYAHVGGGRGRRAAAKGKARAKARPKAAAKAAPKAAAKAGRKAAAKGAAKGAARTATKTRAKAAAKAAPKAAPKATGRRGAPAGGRRGAAARGAGRRGR